MANNCIPNLSQYAYSVDGVTYYKSSFSNNSCVTVGMEKDEKGKVVAIKVGDSKHPHDPPKTYTVAEWEAFLSAARAGGFETTATTKKRSE